ncbi:zinc/cadmium resistance protein [[Candida] railenensis]|uniref:Zinc/cadmium resistance protein n=1 Tax=[Candida] railenensis TaxID=45579 RepID=A0A9P0VXQ0_9ASCO|nr:zinc/cadmium resistance protein [[Candida] railenensis]
MPTNKEIRIIALLVLDIFFFLLEAIVGYAVHSLALVADSFHMLNDIISLFIALWAVRVKNTKPADGKYTYGWQRAEILGALINAVFLLALCFTIVIEAIQRFFQPQEIGSPKLVLIVGIAGLISNGLGLVLFHEHGHSHSHGGSSSSNSSAKHSHEHGHSHSHAGSADEESRIDSDSDIRDFLPDAVVGRITSEHTPLVSETHPADGGSNDNGVAATTKKKSMNMEGVFLHVLGDALGNVGVIATALFIWKTDYSWRFYTDPLVSLVITVIIFSSALPLCRKASKILLQATPPDIDSNLILSEIIQLPDVKSVHDFHIWNLNEDILIASLHLELKPKSSTGSSSSTDSQVDFDKEVFNGCVTQVREILHRYGIHSATIQPEFHSLRTDATQINSKAALNRKASAYGSTNQTNCIVDGVLGCDNEQCLS